MPILQSQRPGRSTGEQPIIYLACPYTDQNRTIRFRRFELATAAAATLVKRGLVVFSPITMTHPMDVALAGDDTLGSDFWIKFDETFMDKCSEMIILQIEGWEQSSGVQREMEFFTKAGKPVSFMKESDIDPLCLLAPSTLTHTLAHDSGHDSDGYQNSYRDQR